MQFHLQVYFLYKTYMCFDYYNEHQLIPWNIHDLEFDLNFLIFFPAKWSLEDLFCTYG